MFWLFPRLVDIYAEPLLKPGVELLIVTNVFWPSFVALHCLNCIWPKFFFF